MSEEKQYPESWTNEDVTFFESKIGDREHDVKIGDVVIARFDPERSHTELDKWKTEELVAELTGELILRTHPKPGKVTAEYATRTFIPAAWSVAEIKTYLKEGKGPELAVSSDAEKVNGIDPEGIWVNDVTRSSRSPSTWSPVELKAGIEGLINVPANVNRSKLEELFEAATAVEEDVQEEPTAETASSEDAAEEPTQAPAPAVASTDPVLDAIKSSVDMYVTDVSSDLMMSVSRGGRLQMGLHRAFTLAVKREGKDLVSAMNVIRDAVKANSGKGEIFSNSHAYRYIPYMPVTDDVQQAHTNLLSAMLFAVTKSKAERGQYDFAKSLKGLRGAKLDQLDEYFRKHA